MNFLFNYFSDITPFKFFQGKKGHILPSQDKKLHFYRKIYCQKVKQQSTESKYPQILYFIRYFMQM